MSYKLQASDYNLKYSDTYLGYKNKGGVVQPFKVEGAIHSDGKIKLSGVVYRNKAWRVCKISVSNKNLVTSHPATGAINTTGGFVLLTCRTIKRQWRITMKKENTSVIDPFIKERATLGLPLFEGIDNSSFLDSIFNQHYPSREEAIKSVIDGERMACAWNSIWYIGLVFTNEHPLIFRNDLPVGEYVDGEVVLKKELSCFSDELVEMGFNVKTIGDNNE